MSETTMNEEATAQAQQQQVQLNGGVYPQPNGTWSVCIWFSGFPNEAAAHHMSGQIEQLIKQAFAPPQPKQEG